MKVGLGITTMNRPGYFKQCMEHIIQNVKSADFIVVINDGSKEEHENEYQAIYRQLPKHIKIIHNQENQGCAKAKNVLLKEMMAAGCTELFICEDDILIVDDKAITEYVRLGREYGFHNLCYALHGPINIGRGRKTEIDIAYYPDSVGAFCYYTREAVDKVGYFDESFYNAMEHVEYSHRIGLEGMTLSFSMFPDISDSDQYLSEIKGSIQHSSIRPQVESAEETRKFKQRVLDALEHWKQKEKHRFPLWDLYFGLKKQLKESV
jgi:GT2 family glycosyltransferase